jgi:hypothetical protein
MPSTGQNEVTNNTETEPTGWNMSELVYGNIVCMAVDSILDGEPIDVVVDRCILVEMKVEQRRLERESNE